MQPLRHREARIPVEKEPDYIFSWQQGVALLSMHELWGNGGSLRQGSRKLLESPGLVGLQTLQWGLESSQWEVMMVKPKLYLKPRMLELPGPWRPCFLRTVVATDWSCRDREGPVCCKGTSEIQCYSGPVGTRWWHWQPRSAGSLRIWCVPVKWWSCFGLMSPCYAHSSPFWYGKCLFCAIVYWG